MRGQITLLWAPNRVLRGLLHATPWRCRQRAAPAQITHRRLCVWDALECMHVAIVDSLHGSGLSLNNWSSSKRCRNAGSKGQYKSKALHVEFLRKAADTRSEVAAATNFPQVVKHLEEQNASQNDFKMPQYRRSRPELCHGNEASLSVLRGGPSHNLSLPMPA
mgnify:CR=1 FL=1